MNDHDGDEQLLSLAGHAQESINVAPCDEEEQEDNGCCACCHLSPAAVLNANTWLRRLQGRSLIVPSENLIKDLAWCVFERFKTLGGVTSNLVTVVALLIRLYLNLSHHEQSHGSLSDHFHFPLRFVLYGAVVAPLCAVLSVGVCCVNACYARAFSNYALNRGVILTFCGRLEALRSVWTWTLILFFLFAIGSALLGAYFAYAYGSLTDAFTVVTQTILVLSATLNLTSLDVGAESLTQFMHRVSPDTESGKDRVDAATTFFTKASVMEKRLLPTAPQCNAAYSGARGWSLTKRILLSYVVGITVIVVAVGGILYPIINDVESETRVFKKTLEPCLLSCTQGILIGARHQTPPPADQFCPQCFCRCLQLYKLQNVTYIHSKCEANIPAIVSGSGTLCTSQQLCPSQAKCDTWPWL